MKYVYRKTPRVVFSRYTTEAKNIKKNIPYAKVHHVGSTAIKNMGGKGILDILIVVPKHNMIKARDMLKLLGFDYRIKASNKERFFFIKKYLDKNTGLLETVHCHLTYNNSIEERSFLLFRDRLNQSWWLRFGYKVSKFLAVIFCFQNKKVYGIIKKPFINYVLR